MKATDCYDAALRGLSATVAIVIFRLRLFPLRHDRGTMRLRDKANEARLLARDLPRPTRSAARAGPFSLASFLKPNIDATAYTAADIPPS